MLSGSAAINCFTPFSTKTSTKPFSINLYKVSYILPLATDQNVAGKDKDIKARFEVEVKKTERPITLEEVYEQYGGTKEQLRNDFKKDKFADVVRPHYNEMLVEFKRELREWCKHKSVTREAVRKFSPQFNRLIGILDIIASFDKNKDNFNEIYEILAEKAREKY
ncbi:hypothetical protein J4230_00775 [Candidatus Woesearchaeota archaeon]|nr:hypothetical protein [Candidatus Woesearchaeota archaeon]